MIDPGYHWPDPFYQCTANRSSCQDICLRDDD